MGLDLKILLASDKSPMRLCNDILFFDRDNDLFELILSLEKKKGKNVPKKGIRCLLSPDVKHGYHYGSCFETKYGERIKSLKVSELCFILDGYTFDSWKNKAIMEYLANIPNDLKVYLYWC